jgi:hypothetical protein
MTAGARSLHPASSRGLVRAEGTSEGTDREPADGHATNRANRLLTGA